MCLKAKEINKTWSQYEADVGDMYARKHPCSDKYSPTIFTRTEADVCAVWLPRQDQLQDMIIDEYRDHWGNSIMLGLMEECVGWGAQYAYTSMEQAWLAFVMHEKYGKHWNGIDWVVE